MADTHMLFQATTDILSEVQPPVAPQIARDPWTSARIILTGMTRADRRLTQPWADLCLTAEGNYQRYLEELQTLWQHAEQTDDIALVFRCALQAASIHSLSWDMPPLLLAQLAVIGTPVGKWSAEALAQGIARIPGPHQQAQAIAALAPHGAHVADMLLATARTITDAESRAYALIALFPLLPSGHGSTMRDEILTFIRSIEHRNSRTILLRELAKILPAAQRTMVLDEALSVAYTIGDEASRISAIAKLLPLLAPQQLADAHAKAMRSIAQVRTDWKRAMLLDELIPHIPPKLRGAALADAMRYARLTRSHEHRAIALIALAHHASPAQREAALADAMAATRTITNPQRAAKLLAQLCALLPADQQPKIAQEMRESAQTIEDTFRRAMFLCDVLPSLPPAERAATRELVLASARACAQPWLRGQALMRIAIEGDEGHNDLLDEALAHARHEENPARRAELLSAIALHLPINIRPTVLAEALASAQEIPKSTAVIELLDVIVGHLPPAEHHSILAYLAPHWPAQKQPMELAEALNTARSSALTPEQMPPHETDTLDAALTAACAEPNPERSTAMLLALAPWLPIELLPRALACAARCDDGTCRAVMLSQLAARCAQHHIAIQTIYPLLRPMAARGRPAFLRDIAVIAPWIAASISSANLAEITRAVSDIAECWA